MIRKIPNAEQTNKTSLFQFALEKEAKKAAAEEEEEEGREWGGVGVGMEGEEDIIIKKGIQKIGAQRERMPYSKAGLRSGSISPTFYEQLLHAQIPKAQKRLSS